jgi:molybdopterin molybdotransferase
MGPGASFTFGVLTRDAGKRKQSVPMFALAGPPAGCLINFEMLVRPALRKMLGYTETRHPEVEALAADACTSKAPFNFVKWTNLMRTETGFLANFNSADSLGSLPTMAISNALTILPKGTAIKPGDKVQVLPLDWVQ